MGQVVKQVGSDTTRYYWYPGDKKDWLRAAVSLVLGGATYLTLNLLSGSVLMPAVAGFAVTTALTGLNFGRRESRETRELYEAVAAADGYSTRALRRKAAIHSGHALWRRT